jgi:hypothetical protein
MGEVSESEPFDEASKIFGDDTKTAELDNWQDQSGGNLITGWMVSGVEAARIT